MKNHEIAGQIQVENFSHASMGRPSARGSRERTQCKKEEGDVPSRSKPPSQESGSKTTGKRGRKTWQTDVARMRREIRIKEKSQREGTHRRM